jgi:hypothetical protein
MSGPTVQLVNLRAVGPDGLPISAKGLSEKKVLRSLSRILEGTTLCSLATVAPRRRAHSCHVYFAYSPGLELFFLSDPDSNHCRHLSGNPSMSVSVYDSTQRWGGTDRGLALYGTCRETRGRIRAEAVKAYRRRFSAFREWRKQVQPDDPAAKWRFYRFVPRRIKVFDETSLGTGVFAVASVRR